MSFSELELCTILYGFLDIISGGIIYSNLPIFPPGKASDIVSAARQLVCVVLLSSKFSVMIL